MYLFNSVRLIITVTLLFMISHLSLCAQNKIVSTDGTISEILVALGLAPQLVGVDVTSTYPGVIMSKIPSIGHNRSITAESILALQPDIIVASSKSQLKPGLIEQLQKTGKEVVVFKHEYSPKGTLQLIQEIGSYFGKEHKAKSLISTIELQLKGVSKAKTPKKVLFIYARGAGTLMVAGDGTAVKQMIQLTGHHNAVTGFSDFKPLTTEALIQANPDYILLFDTGLESIGGLNGLLKVPGVAQVTAGKKRQVLTMDGLYLMGFGPRIGNALQELSAKIK